jgi:hypothetical protein
MTRAARSAAAAFVVAALVLTALEVHFVNLTFDDAFISFRYAENLATGRGLVFNPGERVEGYSNPLWTVLLAVPMWLGVGRWYLGPLVLAKCIGAVLAVATLWIVRGVALRRGARAAWMALLYCGAVVPNAFWSIGALETPLLALFLVLAVRDHLDHELDDRSPERLSRSSFWFLLAALTRPEPVVLFAVAWALRAWRSTRSRTLGWREQSRFALPFLVPYGAFLAWRLAYYGSLLPNTYYAKRYHDAFAFIRGGQYLAGASSDLRLDALAAFVVLALVVTMGSSRRLGFLSALVATHLAAAYYEGGDWMPAYRLVAPIVPVLALWLEEAWAVLRGIVEGDARPPARLPAWLAKEERLLRYWRRLAGPASALLRRVPPRVARGAVDLAAFAVLALAIVFSARASRVPGLLSGYSRIELDRLGHFEVARWMRANLAPGLLAIGEAGIIPYYTRFPVLDMYGLMDPHIARLDGERHAKFDVDYVLQRRPAYVHMVVTHAADGALTSPHVYGRTLLRDPRFSRDYIAIHEFAEANTIVYRRVEQTP